MPLGAFRRGKFISALLAGGRWSHYFDAGRGILAARFVEFFGFEFTGLDPFVGEIKVNSKSFSWRDLALTEAVFEVVWVLFALLRDGWTLWLGAQHLEFAADIATFVEWLDLGLFWLGMDCGIAEGKAEQFAGLFHRVGRGRQVQEGGFWDDEQLGACAAV